MATRRANCASEHEASDFDTKTQDKVAAAG
jgi:hypothetical protein